MTWKNSLFKVSLIFVAGGIGALITWLSGLPSEPTVIFTISGLKIILDYITEGGKTWRNT